MFKWQRFFRYLYLSFCSTKPHQKDTYIVMKPAASGAKTSPHKGAFRYDVIAKTMRATRTLNKIQVVSVFCSTSKGMNVVGLERIYKL
jgi:hypothetical protein